MKWILWREYRLNRPILIAVVTFLFLPYLVALISLAWPSKHVVSPEDVSQLFLGAAVYSIVLTQLAVAVLGGNAMAGERADRSAQFVAYLPVSRARRVGGKLALAFSVVTLIWGFNLAIIWMFSRAINSGWMTRPAGLQETLGYAAITGLVFYGVGWLISSFQSSTTLAVGGGLITPLLVIMGLSAVAWWMDFSPNEQEIIGVVYTVICVPLAIICFSIGTSYYLNRVEP